jgi:nucleotide-binding universal stress UspA family protein
MNPSFAPGGAISRRLTVVVGVDFSETDDVAFEHAVHLAHPDPLRELHAVHVFAIEPSVEQARELAGRLHQHIRRRVDGHRKGTIAGVHLRPGRPATAIARIAAEVTADLIVVGAHRGQVRQWIVGSTVRELIRASPCPIAVVSTWPGDPSEPREPVVEPPCPECVRVRAASTGELWWCEGHWRRGSGVYTYAFHASGARPR